MDLATSLLFEHHPDPVWVFCSDDLSFLAVNDAAVEKYGYSRREFLQLTLTDLHPIAGVTGPQWCPNGGSTAGCEVAGMVGHRTKEGGLIWVETRTSPVQYQGRPAQLMVVRDVSRPVGTETKRGGLPAQAKDRCTHPESNASLFQRLFEAAPAKFLVLRAADLEIVAATDAYLAATLSTREQLHGRTPFAVFPDDPQDPAADRVRNLRRSLESVKASGHSDFMPVQRYPIPRPGAAGDFEQRFWLPVNVPVPGSDRRPEYIIHRVEDITELMPPGALGVGAEVALDARLMHPGWDILQRSKELADASAQLRHRDAMLRNAERLIGMGSWEFNPQTGAFTCSDNGARIFGMGPASCTMDLAALEELVHPADRERLREQQRAAIGGADPMDVVHRLVRDDDIRFVRQVAEVVRTPDGEVLAGVVQDLTDERLAADAAAAFDLLRIAGRMARLGGWRFEAESTRLQWSAKTCKIHEAPEGTSPTVEEGLAFYVPEDRDRVRLAFARCLEQGCGFDEIARIRTCKGNIRWVRAIGEVDCDAEGRVRGVRGAFQDITELVMAREKSEGLSRRLHETLESMGDAFFTLDRDYRFTFMNSEAERVLQRPRESLLNRQIWAEFPDAVPSLKDAYQSAMTSGTAVELQFHYAPLARWFDVKCHPTRDGLAVYFRDVTREHRTREELLLLQAAVARQNDLLIITEAEPVDAPSGPRIVYVNDAFVRRTGYTREEALGNTPRILQGPGTQRAELDRIRLAIEQGEPVRAELLNYTKSGAPIWLELDIAPITDANGKRTYMVAVERDVTARKEAEQRARINEEPFQLLARATNDVVWDWNLVKDEVWWNESVETMFGYDRTLLEPGSASWERRIFSDDRDRVISGIRAVTDGTGTHWTDEYRFVAADGRLLDVIDRGFVIRDVQGKPVRVLGSMVDITRVKRLEEQLRQSQRLDAIGQLTCGVAHDFNNLLTVIMGNAELLVEDLSGWPAQRMFAETTLHAAARGAELTSRLLAFGRKQALSPRPTDVNALLAAMEGLVRRTLGEHLQIVFKLEAELWNAHADAAQLEAAILNFCFNARDAMAGGGQLTIETANVTAHADDPVEGGEIAPGPYVTVVVSDTGIGMDSETLAHAFEPFFTTKEVGKGSGLGLSMVYGFAKQSRGHVRMSSIRGKGTTVQLFLPRAHAGVQPSRTLPPHAPHSGHESILLVEDNELVRQHVHAQLTSLGYQVCSVADPREAIQALRQSDFDLLFTDIVMPGSMNGRELAEQAVRIRPGLAVLFTSGYAQCVLVTEAAVPAGVQLLQKPYRRRELASAVRDAFDRNVARAAG